MNFQGWTLVTGGSQGLGRQICLDLAAKKIPVVIHYNTQKEAALLLQKACHDLGAEAEVIQGDFTSLESLKDFILRYKHSFLNTSRLINNVSAHYLGTSLETPYEKWLELFQMNLNAPFYLIREILPSIISYQGSIINVGYPGLHHIQADLHATAYSMSKTTLWMLTRSLAKELKKTGVKVNMISPGYLENSDELPSTLEALLLKRLGTLEEV